MRRRLGLMCAGLAAISVFAFACSEEVKKLSGEGGACELVNDCEPGLACVAVGATRRECRRVADAPAAPQVDAQVDGTSDAPTPDAADGATPSADASTLDVSTPDASTPDAPGTPDAADAAGGG